MDKRTIKEIEDALVAKLAPLTATHGVRQIGPYNGELEPEKFEGAVQQWPAVLVHYEGSNFRRDGRRQWEGMIFAVFACDKHQADQSQARRGGPTNPGSYNLLDAVATVLEGKRVIAADDVFPCERVAQQSEIQGRTVSVYSARYGVETTYLVNME